MRVLVSVRIENSERTIYGECVWDLQDGLGLWKFWEKNKGESIKLQVEELQCVLASSHTDHKTDTNMLSLAPHHSRSFAVKRYQARRAVIL